MTTYVAGKSVAPADRPITWGRNGGCANRSA